MGAITTRAETVRWAGLTTPEALNAAASHLGDEQRLPAGREGDNGFEF
ncbi:hypothetical protein [Saccharopolyspora spinosa]|nr:hypothetical protein [Saccharopolyspora spinosa]